MKIPAWQGGGVKRGKWGLAFFLMCWADLALANWTLNVGYHNPTHATYGVNFLYLGSQWGFEVGVGWLDFATVNTDDPENKEDAADDTARGVIAGDVDVKYFFKGSGLRPYAQVGSGAFVGAAAGKKFAGAAGLGGLFYGLGVFAGSPKFYGYLSALLDGHEHLSLQAGVGFDI